MVNSRKTNPLFYSIVILIIIFYSPLFNLKLDKGVFSLFTLKECTKITGTIKNSPVKTSDKKYYYADFILSSMETKKNEKCSAGGIIKIYIPAALVEAYYPGKLYSKVKDKNNFIYETGGIFSFSGKFSQNKFYINETLNGSYSKNIKGKISRFRALCRLQFKRLMYSWKNAGGLLLALLCGAREYTEDSVSSAFRIAGLSHILALSGMHLSMFSGIAMFIGKKSKRKNLSFIIRLTALIIFVWFAGFSPSLLRAFICALLTLTTCAVNDQKNPDMLVILAMSFIIQIIISPTDIYSLGFILSYSALAGILIFNKLFQIFYIRFLPKTIAFSLASSTSAQIFTVPVSLYKFGTYSPIGIIATSFVSPLLTIFIYAGLILIILSLIFPFISNISGIFMNFLYTIIKNLVLIFSKAPVWSIN